MSSSGAESLSRRDLADLIQAELGRFSDRAFNLGQSTLSIISAEVVVLTAGIVAYASYPVAFVLVPLTWAVWLNQSLVNDFDTVKAATYVKWLEMRLNEVAGAEVAGWETNLTQRAHVGAQPYLLAYASYALMNAGSWAFSVWVLAENLGAGWAIALGALWLVHYVTVGVYFVKRPKYIAAIVAALPEGNVIPPPGQQAKQD